MKWFSNLQRAAITLATLAATLVGVLVLVPAGSASAAGEIAVAIRRDTPIPVRSGEPIQYTINVECSATNDNGCTGMVATVPLDHVVAGARFVSGNFVDPSAVTFVRGEGLRIPFTGVINGGTSFAIVIEMATDNFTTPNGSSWDVPVNLEAVGAVSAVTDPPADGSVRAELNLAITKAVELPAQSSVPTDTAIPYAIRVCDSINGLVPGMLGIDHGTIVDTLPPGSVFVSADRGGIYDDTAHTVTWTLTDYRQTWCEFNPEPFRVTVIYPSELFGPEPNLDPDIITSVANVAVVEVTAYGETTPRSARAERPHNFSNDVSPGGVFAKDALTTTTFPGNYNTRVDQFEAVWAIRHGGGDLPHGVEIRDKIPCVTPSAAGDEPRSAHVSPLPGEAVCQTPSFILERLDIVGGNVSPSLATGVLDAIDAGWSPRLIGTDGVERPFNRTGANTWLPPTGVTVAEVIFPYDPHIVFPATSAVSEPFIYLRGHMTDDTPGNVFPDIAEGAIVHNRADFQIYTTDGVASGDAAADFADIRVLPNEIRPQIVKSMTATTVTLEVVNLGGANLSGVVVTDLLPPGVRMIGNAPAVARLNGSPVFSNVLTIEKHDNYDSTNQQLIRFRINPPFSLQPGPAARFTTTFLISGLSGPQVPAGDVTNTAQVFVDNGPDGADIGQCVDRNQNLFPPRTIDTHDLDANQMRSGDRFCDASASLSFGTSNVVLTTRKRVQGNLDQTFQGFPSIGSADPSLPGADGLFRLEVTNRSGIDMIDGVVYDVFPAPNDTGVRTAALRGSTTTARLAAAPTVTAPSGTAVVEYSTAAVPCRGEVQGTLRQSWPSNCDDTWLTSPPGGDFGAVTAIRVSGFGTLPRLANPNLPKSPDVLIDLSMTLPDSARPGDVAWNSFAVVASRPDGTAILPTEPPKVGLAVPQTDVELTKTVNGEEAIEVPVGSEVTYRITARHGTTVALVDGVPVYFNPNGFAPSTARHVVVTDTIPDGLALVAGSATNCDVQNPQAPRGTFDASNGRWDVGDIAPNDVFDLCFRAIVLDTQGAPIRNVAEVSATDGPDDVDSTPGNHTPGRPNEDDEDEAVVTPSANIEIVKQPVANSVRLIRDFEYEASYTVTVRNTGGPGSYTLVEAPQIGSPNVLRGIEVTSAVFGDDRARVSTISPMTVVTDRRIGANETHRYDIRLVFRIAPESTPAQRTCTDPITSGNGAVNSASVTVAGQTTTSTACLNMPEPSFVIDKQPGQVAAVAGTPRTFDATYTVAITNEGNGPGTYNLLDQPRLPAGTQIDGITVVNGPGTPALSQSSTGAHSQIAVEARSLPAMQTHRYVVTVRFTIPADLSPEARRCALATPGQGAFNSASVGTVSDDACIDIPPAELSMQKEALSVDWKGGLQFVARYQITVRNNGAGPDRYTVTDTPGLPTNTTIDRFRATNATGTPAVDVDTNSPVGTVTIASNVDLGANTTHTYDVIVDFTIAADTPDSDIDCGPTRGSGAFNTATLRAGSISSDDEACRPIPSGAIQIQKQVDTVTVVDADTIRVEYVVRVANSGDAGARYDLDDEIRFGVGATVVQATVSNATPGGIDVDPEFTGVAPNTAIVDDVEIAPDAVHVYRVVVTADVDLDPSAVRDGDCVVGQGATGTGLLNVATVTVGTNTQSSQDCAPFSTLQLHKAVINDDGGVAEPGDFTLTADGAVTDVRGTSGVIRVVEPGGYTLGETGPAGYLAGDWDCGAVPVANGVVVVPIAADVVCRIVNDDQPTPVRPDADLAIVKTSNTSTSAPGNAVRWQLAIVNNGPGTAVNVVMTDVVPASMTVIGVTSSEFNCSRNGNSISCTVASLAPGGRGTVFVDSVVNTGTPSGTITNIGRVTSDTPDPNPSNNSDDALVVISVSSPPTPTPPPTTPPEPPVRQPLPQTGAAMTVELLQAALVLVFLGGLVLVVTRRRRDDAPTAS